MKTDKATKRATDRWNRCIEPYLTHVEKRGFVAEVTRQIGVQRQQVDRWLHPDPKVRTEPRAGMGLELIDAMDRAIQAGKGVAT